MRLRSGGTVVQKARILALALSSSALGLAVAGGAHAQGRPAPEFWQETEKTKPADAQVYLERLLPYITRQSGADFADDRYWIDSYRWSRASPCKATMVVYKEGVDWDTDKRGVFPWTYELDFSKILRVISGPLAFGLEGLIELRGKSGQLHRLPDQQLALRHDGDMYDVPKALRFLIRECRGGTRL